MSYANKELYEFDRFRLDVAERILWRGEERVPLSEKAFETLCALVRRGNHLVSKDELLTEVWADTIVEENNLDKNISLLRQVLGERAGEGKFIETVRGHGYRFVAEVREVNDAEISQPPASTVDRLAVALSEPSAVADGSLQVEEKRRHRRSTTDNPESFRTDCRPTTNQLKNSSPSAPYAP